RVVNEQGKISLRGDALGHEDLQAALLRREGVRFTGAAISLARYRWQPDGKGTAARPAKSKAAAPAPLSTRARRQRRAPRAARPGGSPAADAAVRGQGPRPQQRGRPARLPGRAQAVARASIDGQEMVGEHEQKQRQYQQVASAPRPPS